MKKLILSMALALICLGASAQTAATTVTKKPTTTVEKKKKKTKKIKAAKVKQKRAKEMAGVSTEGTAVKKVDEPIRHVSVKENATELKADEVRATETKVTK